MKNIRVFLSENFQFLEVTFSIYLNRRVFRNALKIQKLTTALLELAEGENDRRKYFMINLHERILPFSAGVNVSKRLVVSSPQVTINEIVLRRLFNSQRLFYRIVNVLFQYLLIYENSRPHFHNLYGRY